LEHRHGLLGDRTKKIRFDTKRERLLDRESRGISRRPFPGGSIENE
jgi:hypothetical protein